MADPTRKGMYVGQFTALHEGTYRLELGGARGSDDEQLDAAHSGARARPGARNPQRNDALLSEIAKRTGGMYYVGAEAVLGGSGLPPLVKQLEDRTEMTYLAGVTDRDFDRNWMRGIAGRRSAAHCAWNG